MNVIYLPGLLGSDLGMTRPPPDPPLNVWCDYGVLLAGGASLLQLGPDGISPGPLAEGVSILPTSILAPVYSPLGLYLQYLGYTVYVYPYDWRQSVVTSGAGLRDAARERFGDAPFSIVAHSQGGLVARACSKWMDEVGQGSKITRIVTIATPHYGAAEAIRVYAHLPTLYQGIAYATGIVPALAQSQPPAYLDAVIASWPGLANLLPCRADGPLYDEDPDLAALVYQLGYYMGCNPFLIQDLLDTAAADSEWMLDATAGGKLACIVATGQQTARLPVAGGSPITDAGYSWTQDGDGLVSADAAALPGAAVYTVADTHAGCLLNPQVWGLLPSLLPA